MEDQPMKSDMEVDANSIAASDEAVEEAPVEQVQVPTAVATHSSNTTGVESSCNPDWYNDRDIGKVRRFLKFVRILFLHLEEVDEPTSQKVDKWIHNYGAIVSVKPCPVDMPLHARWQARLKRLVGNEYWQKAEDLLSDFLKGRYLEERPLLSDEEAVHKARNLAKRISAPLRSTAQEMSEKHQNKQMHELRDMVKDLEL